MSFIILIYIYIARYLVIVDIYIYLTYRVLDLVLYVVLDIFEYNGDFDV